MNKEKGGNEDGLKDKEMEKRKVMRMEERNVVQWIEKVRKRKWDGG